MIRWESNLEKIWQADLDNKYCVEVYYGKDFTGEMKISLLEAKEVLVTRTVDFCHKPVFGPDIEDIINWQNLACNIVDTEL